MTVRRLSLRAFDRKFRGCLRAGRGHFSGQLEAEGRLMAARTSELYRDLRKADPGAFAEGPHAYTAYAEAMYDAAGTDDPDAAPVITMWRYLA